MIRCNEGVQKAVHAWLLIDCRVDAGCTGVVCFIFLFMFIASRNLARRRWDISLVSKSDRRFVQKCGYMTKKMLAV